MNSDNKLKILQAVKEKKLSVDEAIKALIELEATNKIPQKPTVKSVEVPSSYPDMLLQDLKKILLTLLKLEESDLTIDSSIIDLGLDSISATEFASRINKRYTLNLLPSIFFEFTSLRSFSKHLQDSYSLAIQDFFAKQNQALVMNEQTIEIDSKSTSSKSSPTESKTDIKSLWEQASLAVQSQPVKTASPNEEENFKISAAKLALISQENMPDTEVAIIGYGPPILVLGGLLQPYQEWKYLVEALSDQYQLIMINPPGCGRSEMPASLALDTIIKSILTVLDSLSIRSPLPVLGYSLGGILALQLILDHPERISALILACTTADTTLIGKAKQNVNILNELSKIHVPTLVIAAENDTYMLPEFNKSIHQKIAGSTYCLFSNAKHTVPFTHHQEFNNTVIHFLENNKNVANASESKSSDLNINKSIGVNVQIQSQKEIDETFCIIGGGPVGIGIGKCLKQNGIAFNIIEQEKDFGGLWGIDHASGRVYSSTHLISSRRNTQFSDFPMPDNYPDYPNHQLVLKYFRELAKHFDLYSHATFNVTVEHIEAIGKYWKVKLSNSETRFYRGVIVANGRLNEPIYPQYPGKFLGTIIHSSEYKKPDIFKNKRVLIVGAGNSGCDIAIDSVHHAKATIQSMRRGYYFMPKYIFGKPTQDWLMEIGTQFKSTEELWDYVKGIFKMAGYAGEDFGLPKPDYEIYAAHPIMNSQILYHIGHGDLIVKPDVKLLKDHSVVFADDSEEKIDLILYASGFQAVFPFLPKKYGINNQEDLHKLFMYSIHREYNNLFFAGYFNTASGLGNIANSAGLLFANYIKALINNKPVLQVFQQLVKDFEPDLGHEKFIKTARHSLEVDLWLLIKTINFLSTKLGS